MTRDALESQVVRLREENERLRAENARLRPLVSELQHRVRLLERHHQHEHHPHDLPPDTIHG